MTNERLFATIYVGLIFLNLGAWIYAMFWESFWISWTFLATFLGLFYAGVVSIDVYREQRRRAARFHEIKMREMINN